MPSGTDTQSDLVRIIERTRLGAHPGAIFFSIFLPVDAARINREQAARRPPPVTSLDVAPKSEVGRTNRTTQAFRHFDFLGGYNHGYKVPAAMVSSNKRRRSRPP